MKLKIFKSILAGILIAIAGWAYLTCQNFQLGDWNKIIGSFLFSLGLIAVVALNANLFTGKIGYVKSWYDLSDCIIILITNLIVAFLIGKVYALIFGESTAMLSRIAKSWYRILVDSIGCGVCIYVAVEGYKLTKSFIPVILGVMVFILAGFEHCIADSFYLGASSFDWIGLAYVLLAAAGNSIGSLLTRLFEISYLLE